MVDGCRTYDLALVNGQTTTDLQLEYQATIGLAGTSVPGSVCNIRT